MESIGSSQASAGSRSLAGHSTMIGGGSSPLASDVLQQQEEERLYALQKGRTFVGSSPTAAAAPSVVPPAPVSLQASFESVYADRLGACDSPGLAPPSAHPPLLTAADDAGSLQSTGAIFLTRFSRRNSSSSALARASPLGPNSVGPPCGPRTSIPDRMLTPGPGSYEVDARKSMAAITSVTADVPSPVFRSRTGRFGGHLDTFGGADPIHLYPGAERPRDKTPWQSPDPTSFRRGRGHMSMASP